MSRCQYPIRRFNVVPGTGLWPYRVHDFHIPSSRFSGDSVWRVRAETSKVLLERNEEYVPISWFLSPTPTIIAQYDRPSLPSSLEKKVPFFCTENAQKIEYGDGGSTECLYILSVVPISLCTKYHRKQVQNFRTSLSTEFLDTLLTRNVLYFLGDCFVSQ